MDNSWNQGGGSSTPRSEQQPSSRILQQPSAAKPNAAQEKVSDILDFMEDNSSGFLISSKIPAFLRNRLDMDNGVSSPADIARSSSAPPTQIIDQNVSHISYDMNSGTQSRHQAVPVDDPRANPEYAAFYYNNSRLDPRLPPPIYSPGQSWQMWAQNPVQTGLGQVAAANPWGTWNPPSQRPPQQFEPQNQAPGGFNNNSNMYSGRGSIGMAVTGVSAPAGAPAGWRSNLVEMIQDDFPRTPSPVYGMTAAGKTDGGKRIVNSSSASANLVSVAAGIGDGNNWSAESLRASTRTPPIGKGGADVSAPQRSFSTPPALHPKIQPNSSVLQSFHESADEEALSAVLRGMDMNAAGSDELRRDPPGYGTPPAGVPLQSSYGYDPRQGYSYQDQMTSVPVPHRAGGYSRPPHSQSFSSGVSRANHRPAITSAPELPVIPDDRGSSGSLRRVKNSDRRGRSESNPTPQVTRSPVLEEFRNTKNSKRFDLRDILGYVVEFSTDQHGSRFIQQKLEVSSPEDREMVFVEIEPHTLRLMADVFGNYVIQKFLEFGSDHQRDKIMDSLLGNVLPLSLQTYGCRVVQKAFEYVSIEKKVAMSAELKSDILKCAKDQNGNHVVQKAVESLPAEQIDAIIRSFKGEAHDLATHPYGCRVIQRMFEFCPQERTEVLMAELRDHARTLIRDQYGNYVIQHIVEKGSPADKKAVMKIVQGQILALSKHKFSSNVVEKVVVHCTSQERKQLIEEVVSTKSDGVNPLVQMMKDQYANYVIQKMLDISDDSQRELLISKIRPHFQSLRKFTYGKHIIAKIEKLNSTQF